MRPRAASPPRPPLVICVLHNDIALTRPNLVPLLHRHEALLCLVNIRVDDEGCSHTTLRSACHDMDVLHAPIGREHIHDGIPCDVCRQVGNVQFVARNALLAAALATAIPRLTAAWPAVTTAVPDAIVITLIAVVALVVLAPLGSLVPLGAGIVVVATTLVTTSVESAAVATTTVIAAALVAAAVVAATFSAAPVAAASAATTLRAAAVATTALVATVRATATAVAAPAVMAAAALVAALMTPSALVTAPVVRAAVHTLEAMTAGEAAVIPWPVVPWPIRVLGSRITHSDRLLRVFAELVDLVQDLNSSLCGSSRVIKNEGGPQASMTLLCVEVHVDHFPVSVEHISDLFLSDVAWQPSSEQLPQ
eukprot:CAMPEP_0179197934 /NCGR_PEP_ID=MMETSP0796-20121207/98438_1 /TAXON_ID=73915 /ORGANISM="Pyrodinium bahamense, Strain pbaha01" /LENGTH=364 /DNA_ID=CAMNT_0020902365 /DNA_START=14 /DNA_END=1108 /DNA_ORIENTATION=+